MLSLWVSILQFWKGPLCRIGKFGDEIVNVFLSTGQSAESGRRSVASRKKADAIDFDDDDDILGTMGFDDETPRGKLLSNI